MPRQPLYLIIPIVAVIAALVLFLQRDNTGNTSQSGPASQGMTQGSAANVPPSTSVNPTPSGTPSTDRGDTPASAMPRAPSGEPARPAERR